MKTRLPLFTLLLIALLLSGCQLPGGLSLSPTATPSAESVPTSIPLVPSATPELTGILVSQEVNGGIAGFCDRLTIRVDGRVSSVICSEEQPAIYPLTPGQLDQLRSWAYQYERFEVVEADDGVADAMSVAITFNGIGSESMPDDVRGELRDLASQVWAQLRMARDGGATASIPDDAIQIVEPAAGSTLTSPFFITGFAAPTFEQNLVIRLLLDDGTELALQPTTIQADIGQRGPFADLVEFSVTGTRQAFLLIYTTSARDGGITHLSSVGVTLSDTGPEDILRINPPVERIHILNPSPGGVVQGGVAVVEGFALASFEGTLVVEVLDEDGGLLGIAPIIVQSSELGVPGPFRAEVPYAVAESGPGRIVVRDPSVVYDGDVHLTSVEITLAP